MSKIIATEKLGDIIVTVVRSRGINHLQFKVPRGLTGVNFDIWRHEYRDELYMLKYLIWVDKVESLA